jgi:hypothetical protein
MFLQHQHLTHELPLRLAGLHPFFESLSQHDVQFLSTVNDRIQID